MHLMAQRGEGEEESGAGTPELEKVTDLLEKKDRLVKLRPLGN